MKKLVTILTLLISFTAFGRIALDVSVISKKGMDQGLTLVSELHSIVNIFGKEMSNLNVSNGIEIYLGAKFQKSSDVFGPSDHILVKMEVLDANQDVLLDHLDEGFIIKIGEKKQIIHKDDKGQIVEITITPKIK
jgi:hypothetical protein